MEKLTLQQALEKFGKTTKQQVERYLTSQKLEFTVEGKGKSAIFTIEGAKVNQWEELIGFEPQRKTAVANLLLFLHSQGGSSLLSDKQIGSTIGISQNTIRNARQELVAQGWIVSTSEQRLQHRLQKLPTYFGDYKQRLDHRLAGASVEAIEIGRFFSSAEDKVLTSLIKMSGEQFLVDTNGPEYQALKSKGMKEQVDEDGSYSASVLKELTKELNPDQVSFLTTNLSK